MKNNTTLITRKIEIIPLYKIKEGVSEEEIKAEKNRVWTKIREVDKWSYKIANRVATECWGIWGKYDDSKIKDLPKIESYKIFSEKLCVEYPELKKLKISNIATGITKEVHDKIRSEFYDYKNGKKTIPNYKSGYPMYIPRRSNGDKLGKYKSIGKLVDKNNVDYIFNTPLGDFRCHFGRDRSNNKHIINQCREGLYELCDSKIQYNKDKNKLFLLAVIRIPIDNTTSLDKNKFLGVDLGIVNPIVATIYDDNNIGINKDTKRVYFKESIMLGSIDLFLKERTKLQAQRKKLQTSLVSAKSGHGRKRKLLSIDKLKKKERNWVRTQNHTYSKKLIDYALKNNCGSIVMEDLSGFNDSEKNKKFIGRNWSYFELQSMVENKAKKHGIEVFKVNPKNTSKACCVCDNIDDKNRKSQANFECTNCGSVMHADYNATRNIVKKHLNSLKEKK